MPCLRNPHQRPAGNAGVQARLRKIHGEGTGSESEREEGREAKKEENQMNTSEQLSKLTEAVESLVNRSHPRQISQKSPENRAKKIFNDFACSVYYS